MNCPTLSWREEIVTWYMRTSHMTWREDTSPHILNSVKRHRKTRLSPGQTTSHTVNQQSYLASTKSHFHKVNPLPVAEKTSRTLQHSLSRLVAKGWASDRWTLIRTGQQWSEINVFDLTETTLKWDYFVVPLAYCLPQLSMWLLAGAISAANDARQNHEIWSFLTGNRRMERHTSNTTEKEPFGKRTSGLQGFKRPLPPT